MADMPIATCNNCGESFEEKPGERNPCPKCGSEEPRTQYVTLLANLNLVGGLSAMVNRRPIRKWRPIGYVITFILAVIGFVGGLIVHSLGAAAIIAAVILVLGFVVNEIWGPEIHHHHEHFPNL